MKSLTTITGNMDDMDQTVLSVEEFARLTNNLAALRLENVQLRAQLEAIGAGGVEPLRKADHFRDAAKLMPLAESEISSLYFEALGSQRLSEQDQGGTATRFARAVERAHGIGCEA